jgi:hypothetical protein
LTAQDLDSCYKKSMFCGRWVTHLLVTPAAADDSSGPDVALSALLLHLQALEFS